MICVVAVAAVVVTVGVGANLVVVLKWSDGIPFWGHPRNEGVLIGTWEGSFSSGRARFVLNEDHTFIQHVYDFADLEPRDYSGTWRYSNGEVQLSPGMLVVYSRPSGYEYNVVVGATLDVHNTVFPWWQGIWDDNIDLSKK